MTKQYESCIHKVEKFDCFMVLVNQILLINDKIFLISVEYLKDV